MIVLGVIAAISLALPEIGLVAAMSFVGLPVTLVLWGAPALFLLLAIARLVWRVLPVPGAAGAIISIVLAAGILAVPAYLLNLQIHAKAQSYVAGDRDELTLPPKADVIALRERARTGRDILPCGGFCLHALLSGTAREVLVVSTNTPHEAFSAAEPAIGFSLQKRAVCPEISFQPGGHGLKLPEMNGAGGRGADPVEEMKLRISEGECLVRRQAVLSEAELVISRGSVVSGVGYGSRAGFSLTADTSTVERTSVHVPAAGGFREAYRATTVRYFPFIPLLLPGPQTGYGMEVNNGWWRRTAYINRSRYDDEYAWGRFLTEKLGFDLALADGEKTKERILGNAIRILDAERAPNAAEWNAIRGYFEKAGLNARNGGVGEENYAVAGRMLESTNFPAPPRSHSLVRYIAAKEPGAATQRLAALLLTKLKAGKTWPNGIEDDLAGQIRNLALGVQALPDEALAGSFDVMTELAGRPEIRQHGWVLVSKLSAFGAEAVPHLLASVETGLAGGEHFFRENEYQQPYLGGLIGLCLAGEQASSALPAVRQWADEDKLPFHASYGELLVNTLTRMGADREWLWTRWSAANKGKERKFFDHLTTRALSDKPRCHY